MLSALSPSRQTAERRFCIRFLIQNRQKSTCFGSIFDPGSPAGGQNRVWGVWRVQNRVIFPKTSGSFGKYVSQNTRVFDDFGKSVGGYPGFLQKPGVWGGFWDPFSRVLTNIGSKNRKNGQNHRFLVNFCQKLMIFAYFWSGQSLGQVRSKRKLELRQKWAIFPFFWAIV